MQLSDSYLHNNNSSDSIILEGDTYIATSANKSVDVLDYLTTVSTQSRSEDVFVTKEDRRAIYLLRKHAEAQRYEMHPRSVMKRILEAAMNGETDFGEISYYFQENREAIVTDDRESDLLAVALMEMDSSGDIASYSAMIRDML